LEGRTTNELEIKQIQTVDFQTELRSKRLRLEKLKTF
jgi:hypothetical protein